MNPLLGLALLVGGLYWWEQREQSNPKRKDRYGERDAYTADLFGGEGLSEIKQKGKGRDAELEAARQEMRRGGHRGLFDDLDERNPGFFMRGGIVHPIRRSDGYSSEREQLDRELRTDEARAHHYSNLPRERDGRYDRHVIRPPWAAGYTDAQLSKIARDHGVNAGVDAWWEEAGLYSGKRKVSGEMKYLAENYRHAGQKKREKVTRTAAPLSTRERQQARRGTSRENFGWETDLPF